jgi:hypothetical protein
VQAIINIDALNRSIGRILLGMLRLDEYIACVWSTDRVDVGPQHDARRFRSCGR